MYYEIIRNKHEVISAYSSERNHNNNCKDNDDDDNDVKNIIIKTLQWHKYKGNWSEIFHGSTEKCQQSNRDEIITRTRRGRLKSLTHMLVYLLVILAFISGSNVHALADLNEESRSPTGAFISLLSSRNSNNHSINDDDEASRYDYAIVNNDNSLNNKKNTVETVIYDKSSSSSKRNEYSTPPPTQSSSSSSISEEEVKDNYSKTNLVKSSSQADSSSSFSSRRGDKYSQYSNLEELNQFDELLGNFDCSSHCLPEQPIYTNEFAVHVPAGKDVADTIANKYGFTNYGQIGSLKDFYLFHHRHVVKRSLQHSDEHHGLLNSESEVLWMQQQHEKVRRKREGPIGQLPGFNPYDILHSSDSSGPGMRIAFPSQGGHRTILPRAPRTQLGDLGLNNIFPDPLFKEQWYLNGGAKDGLDMNVAPAWQKGYTGKGVVVSILDDGIQTNHPDLAQNYDPDASFDINGNDSDPTPQDNGDNKHGTRCAGEVAAVAFNNFCGVGIAYNASIGGVRMLDGKVNDVVEAQALSLNPSHIDIYSASWGPEDDGSTVDGPGPLARRAFIYGVTSGRQGKGSIFVWASGNGGRYTDSCNCDGYTNSIFTLSISSATQAGFKPWYLEECSSTLATTYSSGTPGHDKSVATVDMDGRLRSDHICTVEHTGTSASAPLAAGICALALEANPNLTWRDMQYLVVYTSRPEPLEKESGWILNGIKRKFSHKFGYGLMDAAAMVNLAEAWTSVPPQHICKSRENNEDRKIEGTYGYTLAVHMDVNGCAGTINEVRHLEHVQCRITLRFFPRGNLRILLISPMGTTSTLLFERPRDIVKSNFDDWPFLSVHFWGEKAEGRWTLQVINGGRRRVNQPGILSKWQLIFYGTATQPMRLKNEFAGLSVPGSQFNNYGFPIESDLAQPAPSDGNLFHNEPFSGYVSYQNLFTGAGSSPEQTVVAAADEYIVTPQLKNLAVSANLTNKIILHDCDRECDSQGCYGQGVEQCVQCKHYRLDNNCVRRCPPRTFPNRNGICFPCHESCETCAGVGPDSCLTCASAHLHVVDLAVCLKECLDGYYQDNENKTCLPCKSNCASCENRPDQCTSCSSHLVMYENNCFTSCPDGTYETDNNRCAACHGTCATCNGSSETQCVTCRPGRFTFQGKCLNLCPNGFYADKKRQDCLPCPIGCSTCSANGICLTCNDNWSLNKKDKCIITGSEKCKESEYYSDNQCLPCHQTCRTCDGPLTSNCLTCYQNLFMQRQQCVSSCEEGFYLDMSTTTCTFCHYTCTNCTSRSNCSACAMGLHLQSGECQTNCADGYYSDRGICTKCHPMCHTCSGPRQNQCVNCPNGWQLAAGECYPTCPEGFYKSEFGCHKCHHFCKTCNGTGPLACTSCPSHFMLDGNLCAECLDSQYYDSQLETCKACHDSCHSCFGPNQYSCKTCKLPFHLDLLKNQCVACCPSDDDDGDRTTMTTAATLENEACCKCGNDTGECMKTSVAEKRRIAPDSELQYVVSYNLTGGTQQQEQEVLFRDSVGGGHSYSPLNQQAPEFTKILMLGVAVCIIAITVLTIIIVILQHRNNKVLQKFEKRLNNKNRRKLSRNDFRAVEDNDGDEADDDENYNDDDDDDDDEDIRDEQIRTNKNYFDLIHQQQNKITKLPASRKSFCTINYFDEDDDNDQDDDYDDEDYIGTIKPIKSSLLKINNFDLNESDENESKTPLIHVMMNSAKSHENIRIVGAGSVSNNKSNTSSTTS